MTEISAKTFGRKRWKIMHFLDALPLFILKEKNIDYSAGDHPLGILQIVFNTKTKFLFGNFFVDSFIDLSSM